MDPGGGAAGTDRRHRHGLTVARQYVPPLTGSVAWEAARLAGAYVRFRARNCPRCFGSGVVVGLNGISRMCPCGTFDDEVMRGLPIVIDPLEFIEYDSSDGGSEDDPD